MRYAHTVEQVRSAEEALMATLPEGTLMQRASAGLAAVCADLLASPAGLRLPCAGVAGAGHNGGDALWGGAMLARRGVQVHALLVGPATYEPGLAALRAAGGRVVTEPQRRTTSCSTGCSASGAAGSSDDVGRSSPTWRPVVAVDVPSGSTSTPGTRRCHVDADVTVTFGTHKVAHLVEPAALACGLVELVDIGLADHLGAPALEVLQPDDVAGCFRVLTPRRTIHARRPRRCRGLPQYTGAGVLVVSAAVATGLVGMVRYEGASEDLIRAAHPEVVIGPGQVQAWVVGSGIGRGLASQVSSVLAERLPTLVDADGLRHLPAAGADGADTARR